MRVRVTRNGDVILDGERKALFAGQEYDLPGDVADSLISSGGAESLETKAVEKPPKDKAVRPKRNKSS